MNLSAYLWWQLLLNGHWDGQWQWEETELFVEVVLEHESQQSGTFHHLLLSGLRWRWGQADEAGDENGTTKNLDEFHFDVICVCFVCGYLETDLKSES